MAGYLNDTVVDSLGLLFNAHLPDGYVFNSHIVEKYEAVGSTRRWVEHAAKA